MTWFIHQIQINESKYLLKKYLTKFKIYKSNLSYKQKIVQINIGIILVYIGSYHEDEKLKNTCIFLKYADHVVDEQQLFHFGDGLGEEG